VVLVVVLVPAIVVVLVVVLLVVLVVVEGVQVPTFVSIPAGVMLPGLAQISSVVATG
jgi:hypothetical protein